MRQVCSALLPMGFLFFFFQIIPGSSCSSPLFSLLLLISPSASSSSSSYSFHSRNQKETIEHFLCFALKFWEIQITGMWIYLRLNLTNKPEGTMLIGSSTQLCSQPSAASQPQSTSPLTVTSGKPPVYQVFHKSNWENNGNGSITCMKSNRVQPSDARGILISFDSESWGRKITNSRPAWAT